MVARGLGARVDTRAGSWAGLVWAKWQACQHRPPRAHARPAPCRTCCPISTLATPWTRPSCRCAVAAVAAAAGGAVVRHHSGGRAGGRPVAGRGGRGLVQRALGPPPVAPPAPLPHLPTPPPTPCRPRRRRRTAPSSSALDTTTTRHACRWTRSEEGGVRARLAGTARAPSLAPATLHLTPTPLLPRSWPPSRTPSKTLPSSIWSTSRPCPTLTRCTSCTTQCRSCFSSATSTSWSTWAPATTTRQDGAL